MSKRQCDRKGIDLLIIKDKEWKKDKQLEMEKIKQWLLN